MKKHLWGVALVCALLFAAAGSALANPPGDIKLAFNTKTHLLTVTALHDVKDATKHYIGVIEVSLDGKSIITQKFSSQTDKTKQVAQYVIIDAKAGSKLSAKATCNFRGEKEGTLLVK